MTYGKQQRVCANYCPCAQSEGSGHVADTIKVLTPHPGRNISKLLYVVDRILGKDKVIGVKKDWLTFRSQPFHNRIQSGAIRYALQDDQIMFSGKSGIGHDAWASVMDIPT